jgi:hypothetical protein
MKSFLGYTPGRVKSAPSSRGIQKLLSLELFCSYASLHPAKSHPGNAQGYFGVASLHKAGSAKYKPGAQPEGLNDYEYRNLLSNLAPYESDGAGDTDKWNLFAKCLNPTAEALDDPHDLSMMLQCWNDVVSLPVLPYYLMYATIFCMFKR